MVVTETIGIISVPFLQNLIKNKDILKNHSPLTENLFQLWSLSPHQAPTSLLPQSQQHPVNVISALGTRRHLPGLSELWVLLLPRQWV